MCVCLSVTTVSGQASQHSFHIDHLANRTLVYCYDNVGMAVWYVCM